MHRIDSLTMHGVHPLRGATAGFARGLAADGAVDKLSRPLLFDAATESDFVAHPHAATATCSARRLWNSR